MTYDQSHIAKRLGVVVVLTMAIIFVPAAATASPLLFSSQLSTRGPPLVGTVLGWLTIEFTLGFITACELAALHKRRDHEN